MKTRFMQVMFSATEQGDEELTSQVAGDIEDAKHTGAVDTDEVSYISLGDGKVMIIDKANGECTIAEVGNDDSSSYDLIAVPSDEMDKFLHPAEDGVTPANIPDHEDEDAWEHAEQGVVSPEVPGDTINHESGYESTVEENAEREFSVTTDNTVVLRIFSDQEFCERIFSEVIESEDTAVVGNLKVEKVDDDTVVVTDTASGDQAKIELDGKEMEVTELDQKEMSFSDVVSDEEGEQQYEPLYVVGIDTINNQIIDSPVFDPEEAQDLAAQLQEIGVEAVEIFDNPEDARDHADSLLGEVGVSEVEQLAEPEQAEFSDHTVYVTRYFSAYDEESDVTDFMMRLFSETPDSCDCQESVEDAIESGEQIEDDNKVITPVDAKTAVIEDKANGEFTKATLKDDSIDVEKISEEEADDLTEGLATEDEDAKAEEEAEKAYAIASLTDFEYRLFSEDETGSVESEEKVRDAIESGEQIETSAEVITPVDAETAVVEDKSSGEFTKVTVDDEGLDTEEISESEADDLTDGLAVSDEDEKDDEDDSEEKKYSYVIEEVTSYMERLYSGDEDSDEIEDAIESGESVEDDDKKITPIDAETAVIEDKDNGEFTKATIDGEDLDVKKISEEEAEELLGDLAEEETEDETEEREYSEWLDSDTLGRYFSDAMAPAPAPAPQGAPVDPQGAPIPTPEEEQAMMAQQGMVPDSGSDPIASVENIEDKALVAVQSIQDAANQAVQAIQAAKEAPVPGQEEDLQEAQFSEYYDDYDYENGERYYTEFLDDDADTLTSWLSYK